MEDWHFWVPTGISLAAAACSAASWRHTCPPIGRNDMDIATGFDYLTKSVGVGGGLLGLIAYLNSRQTKALELRVQLRTRRHDFSQLVDQVGPLMASALQSRRNVNAAI